MIDLNQEQAAPRLPQYGKWVGEMAGKET
jgi:hypothetical protein